MCSANWHVFKELFLNRFSIFTIVTLSSQTQRIVFSRRAFNIAYLDGTIKAVAFCLQRSEQSVDMLSLIALKSALWILNLKNSEIEILAVKLL